MVIPDVWVEELPPHKALRLIHAEFGVINGLFPTALDRRDHMVNDLLGLLHGELELSGSLAAEPELAMAFPGSSEGNGLVRDLP